MSETTAGELWPELTGKTVGDLALECQLSKQRVWTLIHAGRVPSPLRITTRRWEYSPQAYRAAVSAVLSRLQDTHAQVTMRVAMRLRRELTKATQRVERARRAELVLSKRLEAAGGLS